MIQIRIYYLLEVLPITFIVTLVVKFIEILAFPPPPQKKGINRKLAQSLLSKLIILKSKNNVLKIYNLEH